MTGTTLVNSPEADAFIQTMNLSAGRKSILGDQAKFDGIPHAYNAVGEAHEAIIYALPKVMALTDDPTRTQPQLHDVGRQFAERTNAVLAKTQQTLIGAAKKAEADAYEDINSTFVANPSRAGIESEIRGWIRDHAKTEGGIAKIHAAVESNQEIASVFYHSPLVLLNIGQATWDNIAMDAVVAHLPQAAKLIVRSDDIMKVANKYPQIMRSVKASFYNEGVADLMRMRVEA